MENSTPPEFENKIDDLQVQINKLEPQKSVHTWWARRPAALARILTYLSLIEGHDVDPEFLVKLAKNYPSTKVLQLALNKIRDSQWQHIWRSNINNPSVTDVPSEPTPLKILDPFAGSGSIPLEALRFGCDTYAGDLNPISSLILCSVLQYPQEFSSANPQITGTSPNKTWNGLDREIQYWAKWVEQKVLSATKSLFINSNKVQEGYSPTFYLWVKNYKCSNPSCPSGYFPSPATFILDQLKNTKRYVDYEFDNGKFNAVVKTGYEKPDKKGKLCCPACGTVHDMGIVQNHMLQDNPFLAVVILTSSNTKTPQYISGIPEDMNVFASWSKGNQVRLHELLTMPYAQALKKPLIFEQTQIANKPLDGINTFIDLFTNRQLLVGLEFMYAINDAGKQMKLIGLPEEIVNVLKTYLALLMGFVVEHNSKLCTWSGTGRPLSSFARSSYFIPQLFVERTPRGIVDLWLNKVLPTVTELGNLPKAQQVYCGDAAHLDFEDNYFDAIVTDPPYYDNVPYSDLADFFWVWESGILSSELPKPFNQANIEKTNIIRETFREDFTRHLIAAFKECFRVLKPGGALSILLTSRSGFEEYINYIQQAGMEIISVKRVPEEIRFKTESTPQTLLIFAHKPYPMKSGQILAADPEILGKAIDQGREKQLLYSGLAELLGSELDEKDYQDYVPVGAKGSKNEVLMEVIAICDLPDFLEKTLGKTLLRRIANRLTLPDDVDPLSALLSYFGFNSVFQGIDFQGAKQISEQLFFIRNRIQSNNEKPYIRGLFMDGSTYVEKLLRQTLWGWAQIAFGPEKRDQALLDILTDPVTNTHPDLDRLAFGHIAKIFRELPDFIVRSPETSGFRSKLGRPHIYNPKNKQTTYSNRVDDFVTLRNKVEHDKEGYWSNTQLSILVADLTKGLDQAKSFIEDLSNSQAIPNIAFIKEKTEDQFGRVSYKIKLDNGNEITIFATQSLKLGSSYMYFPGASNPKPVDPLLLLLDEIGVIP